MRPFNLVSTLTDSKLIKTFVNGKKSHTFGVRSTYRVIYKALTNVYIFAIVF